jgi:hypothetical protein
MSVQVPLGKSKENAADRIMRSLDNRLMGEPKPSRKQVGMVLHALADHTAIMEMVQLDRLDHHGSNAGKETKYWPTETSIGRWFHAVGDDLEGRFQ